MDFQLCIKEFFSSWLLSHTSMIRQWNTDVNYHDLNNIDFIYYRVKLKWNAFILPNYNSA